MAITKKLIGFDEELVERIEKYSKNVNESFTGAVRNLILLGLTHADTDTPTEGEPDSIDLITRVKKLEQDISWWSAEDTQSKVGNIEATISEFDKRLNVLTKVSQLFKGHLKNREIHLQD